MAGPLRTHPFVKTFDELRRSHKRIEDYLDVHFMELNDDEKERLQIILEAIDKAISNIPQKYRVTRYMYFKED